MLSVDDGVSVGGTNLTASVDLITSQETAVQHVSTLTNEDVTNI